METHDSSSLPPARILIVDDHPNTASMLARALGKFETPVEVITACSGEEAIETIGDGLVDVLITDFMMTGMSGLDLIEKLKGGREPAHTILITAFDTPGLAITARRLKVQDYLVKPVQPEKIRDIVSRVLSEIRPSPSGNGKLVEQKSSTILVADDNPDNIRLLAVRLKSEGYEYTTAMDGEETLQQLHENPPDLLLLDINMPKKDGFQVLKEMRADSEVAHIPVIVITAARIMVNDIREGLTLGADDYVTKPVDWRELSARIRAKLRVKQAEDALRSRNRELGMLPEIGETLTERLDINSLTEKILSQTIGALNATNGFLIIFRPDGSSFFNIFKELESTPWTLDELHNSLTNDGLASFIVANQQPIIIENTRLDQHWQEIPNEPAQSAIGVPLLGRQSVLGVLILTHSQVGFFQQDHLKIIQAVASQAAMAVENAQLFAVERKRVNELVALNQVTHEISLFTHMEELFKNIPQLINQSLGYPTVAFWEVINQTVSLKGISGADKALRQSLLAVAPQQAVVTGLPTQFSGPMEERIGERSLTGKPPTQSVIAVPLSWAGRVGGVLSIHSQQTSAFQESDRVLLEMLASQVVTVLERIRLYESVEQERKRLAAVLYGAADAILVLDADGRLQLANHAGKRLFTDIDMQLGFPLPVEKGYDALIELLRYERQTNFVEQGEVPWPDGRTFSVQIAPIEVGGQVAILHDVSHFKALDQLKNEFIATASHDLKNPIFAVLGYADLLKKAGPLNEMQGEFMQRIRNAAVQMQDLVLNLLEIARMEMGTELNKENVNIHELLNEVAEEFKSQVEAKNHEMTVCLAEESAIVYGDRVRLQQVIRNLLGNAIKYTPNNGEVHLRTEIDDGKLDIQFIDTGIGIPAKDIPNLFTKFFRVQNEATKDIEGNGLGLAIVKSIVEQHKGNVSVVSQVGVGSTFRVSLPIAR